MREYMISLGSVLMLVALSEILLPPGGIKRFASLAMGFMLISTAVAPLPASIEDIKLEADAFRIDEEELARSNAVYRAEVLKKHRENLAAKIKEHIKHGSEVYVETTPEGEITRVSLHLKGDESAAVIYITGELGVPRERIKLIYDNN